MRFLIVSRIFPMRDRNAGDLRFAQIIERLAAEHAVTFCATALEWQRDLVGADDVSRYREALAASGARILDHPVAEALRTERFDVAFFEFHDVAAKYTPFVRYYQPRCKVVVDSVDLHFERIERESRVSGDPRDARRAKDVRAIELAIYREADVVLVVSDREIGVLRDAGVDTPVSVVPTINDVSPSLPVVGPRSRLVFVGGFNHPPNLDGILYFCRDIWPTIRAAVPTAELTIIGNAPTDEVTALAHDGVTVAGFVPDTRPYLESSGIAIVPVRFGGGLKGKVGEAMGFGLPVVGTSIGVEGYDLQPGVHAVVADTPEAFAAEVIALIRDPVRYERMREFGWRFFEARFGPQAIAQRLSDAVKAIDAAATRRPPLAARFATGRRLRRMRFDRFLHQHFFWRLERSRRA